jgi:peptidoglycan-N-acetylglucosamine deacetylase
VTPKVLDILDSHRAKASFFVIGDKAAVHPELIREIVKRGHSIENHSRGHSNVFGFFAWTALRKDIGSAQEIIAAIAGRPPAFFRSPMGIRNPLLDPVIARLGLRYITWTRRGFDTVAGDPSVVLDRLTRRMSAGDILVLHDRRTHGQRAMVLEVLPALLEKIAAAGLKPVSLTLAMQ